MPSPFAEVSQYQESQLMQRGRIPVPDSATSTLELSRPANWTVTATRQPRDRSSEFLSLRFECMASSDNCSVGVAFECETWSPTHYVLLPGAVYAGNRFDVRELPYSPRLESVDARPDVPTIISDVPRLSKTPGPSRLQLLTGDMATPAVGIFDPQRQTSWWLFAEPQESPNEVGFALDEALDRKSATVRLTVPGIREQVIYRHCSTRHPSKDRGGNFAPGAVLTLSLVIWHGECADVPAFLDRFLSMRECVGRRQTPSILPFSFARSLVEQHYNRDNWREAAGFYATDCSPDATYPFQAGWCGGGIASAALAQSGDPQTRHRADRTLENLLTHGASPSGFFWGKAFADGSWGSDFCRDTKRLHIHNRTLIRRQADVLYFGLQRVHALGTTAPAAWKISLRACADSFVHLWRTHGQFGQFADQFTGELLIGNSTSGALVPGALAMAASMFGEPDYLEVAEASARSFRDQFVRQGYTTGGPGDALQNPDSESCAALLESYMQLHATTGAEEWLEAARATAALLATWVMSYDYTFPISSEFGRLGMLTTGTVFANTQNKHSAPGICTGSGIGLWKLYRATRDSRYLSLLRDIARALPQFVSCRDRPIHAADGRALPSGWINERVNTSDWDDNIGGVFFGSTWSEVALLLTATELPGVYVDLDAAQVWVLDHMDATLTARSLELKNPTRYPARVKVAVDGHTLQWTEVDLPAGGTCTLPLALSANTFS